MLGCKIYVEPAWIVIELFTCNYSFYKLTVYGAALLEHCLLDEGFAGNVKIGEGFNLQQGKEAAMGLKEVFFCNFFIILSWPKFLWLRKMRSVWTDKKSVWWVLEFIVNLWSEVKL